ncbi:MAG TPA: beta-ketoacyl-[acyl-carrier-protein] synthase family protein [Phycisphaerae bacterium]|nr:beta-ketoacyl-[acyl-carrier-protein] synthase family protein [Phycisphaerae bacterium]HOJ56152.1 beta-ketoacyl-[acyl-carrier-protein] synthase family protein [Phycisphaerae bacterium]HOL28097.1 beta-ketoacyl-[acyl-carrier-protein] synthase family protein [Phycisphaerae bacterium]HPP19792.1 beta-ketoacyl-[acyl-carrier-protein] synthase family protein [Phycisphaerae bacterium]HPU33844.1 beta-ketoacyl-[acyl-carrier-protein] synthase family protein [Phycisphaerae bacterium]
MSRRRVVITGMGWVTPLGDDLESVWQRLLAGESGIAKTTLFDASTFPTTFSAEVKEFDLAKYLGPEDAARHKHCNRNAGFALAAVKMAWDAAGLSGATKLDSTRIGIYLGSGEGPIDFDNFVAAAVKGWDREANGGRGDLDARKWCEVASQRLNAITEFEQDPNMAAGHIACQFNIEGPTFNTLTACAASTQAIGEATNLIRRGDADVVVSGGTHSMIHPFGVTGFNRLTALSTRNDSCITASRPFDRTRDGFVLGEGAGILILEEYEHAKARNAPMLAEITGYGSTADAFRITDIHEDGRGGIAAMRLALADAGLEPKDIHYISAHGTGTEENDKIESKAIQGVFGEWATKVPVSSVKSMLGHLIAAAGAVELITCVLAIRDGILPPTMNYSTPDPNCPLDYVPNKARKAEVKTALSNSFGFGGQNDTLVVTKVTME